MKKLTAPFLFFITILASCNDQKPSLATTSSSANLAENTPVQAKSLAEQLEKYAVPSQHFTVSATKPSQVKGKKGTVIRVNPSDLETSEGEAFNGKVEVELKELTKQSELLRSNAQTVSNGRLLVSGGAYYINMTSASKQLRLKRGKTLSVVFPKLSDQEMALFYGQRDSLGQMNWKQAQQNFIAKAAQQHEPVSASTKKDTNKNGGLDALIDYIEGGDTTTTPEERKAIERARKNRAVSQKVYEAINLESFGWINCDRFLEIENKTDVLAVVNPQDSITSANVYLVFKDINSVMQKYYFSGGDGIETRFEDIPVGYQTKLIAYTVKDGQVYAYSSNIKVVASQRIDLRFTPVAEKEFASLLSK